jgi:signal transduction histidine kinase
VAPRVEVVDTGLEQPIPPDVELAAYRIASEAMTNVVRHAAAEHCRVSIVADDDALTVTVCDDGIGIDETNRGGVGRGSMLTRAEEHGGAVCVTTGDAGTTVTAVLPLRGGPDT